MACARRIAHEVAGIEPAIARVRYRSRRGARRGVPRPSAPPIGLPRTPQPLPSQRVGVRAPLRSGPRLRSLRSLRRGRMAPRSREPRARPEESGRWAARGPNGPLRFSPASLRCARSPARTPPASLHRRAGSARPSPTVPAIARSWNTRAQTTPLRCASLTLLAPTPRANRSTR
jgi:hypothetical protein